MMEIDNSNDRFQEVLLLPEKPEYTASKSEKSNSQKIEKGDIKFENYSTSYPGQKRPSLTNLNFMVKEGSLLGVIGLIVIYF